MKKINFYLFLAFSLLLGSATQAQIKLHSDGHVSIGDLSHTYGIQVEPNGFSFFKTRSNLEYSWANLSAVNNQHQKHWVVSSNNGSNHVFYVYGNGVVWNKGCYTIPEGNLSGSKERTTIDGEEAIDIIRGLNGYYFSDDAVVDPETLQDNPFVSELAVEGILKDNGKRRAGLSAEELDAVFPEAVRTDPEARLGIDYVSVIAVLVEAVKQQQAEIESLKEALVEKDK